ncbi:MAG: succinylglutamate desuccinylase/aspartoacylase family protein [Gemmataceae bacterium]
MSDRTLSEYLDVGTILPGTIRRRWLSIASNYLTQPISIPILAARGLEDGPILGLTAALHGNELNGIPVIQQIFQDLDATHLKGTLIGVPVLNIPAFEQQRRFFPDDSDLNRIMPGKDAGNQSEVYCARLLERLLVQLDYLLDFHTASFGRINSHYVRADLSNLEIATLARLQNSRIIVNNKGGEGTLRSVVSDHSVIALTVELCDPHVYQMDVIQKGQVGVQNTLVHLGMLPGTIVLPEHSAVECDHSYWIHTDQGGLLEVYPDLGDLLAKGTLMATLRNVFGDIIREYYAPDDGIVVGKSSNPVNRTGGRILHLGLPRR